MKERKKLQDEGATQCQDLKDIEEAAMKEDDLSTLGVLFEQYRQVYSEEREAAHEGAEQKRRKLQDSEEAFMETTGLKDADKPHQEYKRRIVGKHTPRDIPTSARDLAQYGDTDVESDAPKRRKVGKQRMQELPSSSSDVAQYNEVHMEIYMILKNDTGRYAGDDVNNMELPPGSSS